MDRLWLGSASKLGGGLWHLADCGLFGWLLARRRTTFDVVSARRCPRPLQEPTETRRATHTLLRATNPWCNSAVRCLGQRRFRYRVTRKMDDYQSRFSRKRGEHTERERCLWNDSVGVFPSTHRSGFAPSPLWIRNQLGKLVEVVCHLICYQLYGTCCYYCCSSFSAIASSNLCRGCTRG